MDINIILFNDFETLDAFGPVEIFGKLTEEYTLKYYSLLGGIITSSQEIKIVTEPLETASINGIVLIPGGRGTRELVLNEVFINSLKIIAEKSKYCLNICTCPYG